MKHRIELLRRLVRMLDESALACLVLYFSGIIVAKEMPTVSLIATVIVCFVLSRLIRERMSYGWIVFLHIAMTVICALIPGTLFSRIMPGLIILFYMLPSSYAYASRGATLKPVDEAPWPLFMMCVAADIYGYAVKSDVLMRVSYIVLLILLTDYLLCLYLDGTSGYIRSTKDVNGLPIRKMLQVNAFLIGGIILVIAIFIFLTRNVDFSEQLKTLLSAVVLVLKSIASALLTFVILIILFFGRLADTSGLETMRDNLVTSEDMAKASGLWDVIIGLLFFVIVGFILFKVLSVLLKFFTKKRRPATDIVEVVEKNTDTEVEVVDRKESPFVRLSKKERARRIYRERILRYRNHIRLAPNKTCRDIEEELFEQELDDVGPLTDLYEKVRYGDLEVTREVLREMNRV